jgi:phosphoribosylglycinamide formyltransferase 1
LPGNPRSLAGVKPLRCVATASTGGSVLDHCLRSPFFRSLIHSVVTDRDCGALEKAAAHGVPAVTFAEADTDRFSDRLLPYLREHAVDYVFSFYTGFYGEALRRAYTDRIVNLHPSLLPAFKGNDAWFYQVPYGARFAGNTVELIHERMDEGKIVLQTSCPWDANQPPAHTRHRVFVQQCQALLQVARWLAEDRIRTDGARVHVTSARFDSHEFSPALDFAEAIAFPKSLAA